MAVLNRKRRMGRDINWETFYASETNAYIQFFIGNWVMGEGTVTLHSIYIFLQSGETLLSQTSPVVKLDQTLLTGLLTAIREFGHEAIEEEISMFDAGAYRFHYDVLDKLISVGLADSNDDELSVKAVLHSLNVLFFNQFESLLKKWRGDVKPFQAFLPVIDEALRAHNERSEVVKIRISSTEYLLSTYGEVLDVILLNLFISGAIIMCGPNEMIEQVSKAFDHILPFNVPNMHGISDLETAQGILASRTDQRLKYPTLLGVTEDVYRGLTTPENLEHYLFVNVNENPPVYLAPLNQPSMDLSKQALRLGKETALQARLLELQLEMLRVQLQYFMKFRRSAQHFTLEDLRTLLHYDSERFRLLAYLARESILLLSPGSEEPTAVIPPEDKSVTIKEKPSEKASKQK